MKRRSLLDWEREAIVMAMAANEKVAAIAAEFGVSPAYPSVLARRRGVPPRPEGRPKTLQIASPVLGT